MRERIPTALAVLATLFMGVSWAADKPKSRWPATLVPETVTPPSAVSVVSEADDWFLIERDEPAIVTPSPLGFVVIKLVENSAGCPVKYKGRFAGGNGRKEEKTSTAKYIYEVTPIKTGRCEIFVIPIGVKTEGEIERRTVDVKAGDGAQPPPVDPVDPPTKPTKGYFLIVRPDGPASAEFVRIFSDPAWSELKAAGHTVKEMTLSESIATYKPPAGTAVPYCVTLGVVDGKSKVVAGPVNLPTDSAGIRKLAEGIK